MGWASENVLFYNGIPSDTAQADVLAIVRLESGTKNPKEDYPWGVMAAIVDIKKGALKIDDKVRLEFQITSCGPWHEAGEQGLIVANVGGETTDGYPVLKPVMNKMENYMTDFPKNADDPRLASPPKAADGPQKP